ncbi:protein SDA1 homolog [Stegodyphus dumicola]|uniref:protein SDA1 homolog n=1 Tax=Stegodyphus dumicola TaxID=202533 RepID=UPI0015AEBB35|nr:protein SDA1 homolog [Stegodyphus dumicola]
MIELYRRNIWRDAKTVNAIATACFSKVNKILVAAHQFFLGVDKEDDEEKSDSSESEDDTPTVREVMNANKVNKKSRRRMRILKRTKQVLKKSKKNKNKKEVFDFYAIHLLHDPQGMAEKLLKMLEGMNERYEIKVMVMNFISRLVGVHSLILLNFYPLLIRYLKPHQRDVTKILMFAAQAAHEQVPPDVMEPVLKTIANNFITERNSAEVITVGINAIREICIRCPFAIDRDLLHDLVQYKKYKNKNVMMAARSLIQLFRRINPNLLQRKYRNKPTEAIKELKPLEYGALDAKSYVPGAETLPLEPLIEDVTGGEVVDSDDDSEGSWVDVSHSEDELMDSDEEEDQDSETEAKDEESSSTVEEKSDECKTDVNQDKSQTTSENSNVEKEKSENTESKTSQPSVDNKEKAIAISQSRILSQEEFKKLKVAQVAKELQFAKGKKRKADNVNVADIQRRELVSLKDIEKLHKRPKPDKETRLATVLEGREGREKFGKKKNKSPFSSKTQKEHNKNKAFMMIKHKVRAKVKRSFKDKQIALRNALSKRKRNK